MAIKAPQADLFSCQNARFSEHSREKTIEIHGPEQRRDISAVNDACNLAMTLTGYHDRIRVAANNLMCGGR